MKLNAGRIFTVFLASCVLAFVAAGCASVNTAVLRGDSLAGLELRRNVYKTIKSYEKDCYGKSIGRGLGWYNNPNFWEVRFSNAKIIEPRATPKSPWKEVWEVQRDGVSALYTIQFYSDEKGGTAFNITFPPELRDEPSNNGKE